MVCVGGGGVVMGKAPLALADGADSQTDSKRLLSLKPQQVDRLCKHTDK
jgi:hypothetical protein